MGRFDGKAVLVTGAAQGMGRAIATRFLEEGASVTVFDLDAALLEHTLTRTPSSPAAYARRPSTTSPRCHLDAYVVRLVDRAM